MVVELIAVPSGESADLIADWLEAVAFLDASRTISKASAIDALHGAGVDNAKGRVNSAWRELRARSGTLGGLYPFEVRDEALVFTGKSPDDAVYSFLLLLSTAMRSSQNPKPYDETRLKPLTKAFEHLAVHSLSARFSGGELLNIGDTRDPDLPQEFVDCLEHVATKSGEPRGTDPIPDRVGDGGADILAWYPMGDDRPGQLFFIAQCTVGDDLEGASEEISNRRWDGFIHTYVPKVKVIAFPYAFTDYGTLGKTWTEWSARTGAILLDRIRLAKTSADRPLSDKLQSELTTWLATLQSGFLLDAGK